VAWITGTHLAPWVKPLNKPEGELRMRELAIQDTVAILFLARSPARC